MQPLIYSKFLNIIIFGDGNKNYSSKLLRQLRVSAGLINYFPLKGKKFEGKDIRYVVSGVYIIIYRIAERNVEILNIWDSRRNPDKLSSKLP